MSQLDRVIYHLGMTYTTTELRRMRRDIARTIATDGVQTGEMHVWPVVGRPSVLVH